MTLGTDFSRLTSSNGSGVSEPSVPVPEPVFKLVAEYLAGRPWREVNHLIVALERAFTASKPD